MSKIRGLYRNKRTRDGDTRCPDPSDGIWIRKRAVEPCDRVLV